MATWSMKVQRYRSNATETRISAPQHFNAENFDQAYMTATNIVRGMSAADPDSEYRITELSTHDYRGENCEGGIHPFETREEMQARLAAKQPKA